MKPVSFSHSRSIGLPALVHELLLGRLDGLPAPQVAAFLEGWCSALELIRRTDLCLPEASAQVRAAIEALVEAIECAQATLLSDPDG